VYAPSVVAQSFWEVLGEEKTDQKNLWEEEFMTRPEERSKRRVWKSREIVKRKGINMSRELAEISGSANVCWWWRTL
jgi:hypothetical protein